MKLPNGNLSCIKQRLCHAQLDNLDGRGTSLLQYRCKWLLQQECIHRIVMHAKQNKPYSWMQLGTRMIITMHYGIICDRMTFPSQFEQGR